MKLFIIAFLAISVSAFKLLESEIHGSSQIHGGTLAKPGEFPYIITLHKKNNTGHYCGGSIYSEKWVITAAHCLDDPAHRYEVIAGEHEIGNSSGTEVITNVAEYFHHENWDRRTIENDIALIKLKEPYIFNDAIKSIKLNNVASQPGDSCTLAGWGSITGDQSHFSRILHKVVLPIVSDDICIDAMGYLVTEENICAGKVEGGGDSCYGDNGGPLVVKDKADNSDLLAGIISWGSITCGAPNTYSVSTEVIHYIDWIEKTVADNE